jgi:hypothetical protein
VLAVLLAFGIHRVALAQTRPSTDPANDPRPAIERFFDAVRHSDKAAAMQCWENDVEGDERRVHVAELVSHLLDEMIASQHLEQALASKLPDVYRQVSQSGNTTPTDIDVANAKYTVYRRLAIVSWGRRDESGFPMEFDNRPNQQRWKISMRQWYTTNRSSVGDSMLLSGWGAKTKERTAADILDDKVKTNEQLQKAYLRHMREAADAGKQNAPAAATSPAR